MKIVVISVSKEESMSLNSTPSADRVHIGIFGRRNAGKSSIINAITGQNLAIVSDTKGTTTDPVLKAMELLPLGPVVLIDTPGLDDEGALGKLRIEKAYQVLNKTDIALLVVDSSVGMTKEDEKILAKIRDKNIPYLVVYNKCDILPKMNSTTDYAISVSASAGTHIHELKERIAALAPQSTNSPPIVRDLLKPNDFVILVVPVSYTHLDVYKRQVLRRKKKNTLQNFCLHTRSAEKKFSLKNWPLSSSSFCF